MCLILFQKIMTGTRSIYEDNYRVQKMLISDLLNGYTRCNGAPLP